MNRLTRGWWCVVTSLALAIAASSGIAETVTTAANSPDGVYRVDGKPFLRRAGYGGINTFGVDFFLHLDEREVGGERDYYTHLGLNTAFFELKFLPEGGNDFAALDECFRRAKKAGLKVVISIPQSLPPWLAKKRNWHWIGGDGSVIPNVKGYPHHNPAEYASAVLEVWGPILQRARDNPLLIGYQISGEHHPFDTVSARVSISFDEWTLGQFREAMKAKYSLKEISRRYGGKEDFYSSFDDLYPAAAGNNDFKGRKLANPQVAKWDWYRFKKTASVACWTALVQTIQKLDGHGRSIHYEWNHGPYSDGRLFPMSEVAEATPGIGFSTGIFEDSIAWDMLYSSFVPMAPATVPWINNELGTGWTGSFRNDPTSVDALYMRRHVWGTLMLGSQGYNFWTFCNLMNYTPDARNRVEVFTAPTFGRGRPLKYFEVKHTNRLIDSLGEILAGSVAPKRTIGLLMLDDSSHNGTFTVSYSHDSLGIVEALVASGMADKLGILTEYHLDSPNVELNAFKTLILPRAPRITETHMQRLAGFVEKGGHLLVIGESGRFGETFNEFAPFPGGPLAAVVGCDARVLKQDELRKTPMVAKWSDGTPLHLDIRTALIAPPRAGARVVATAGDVPAVVENRFGKGICHYLTGACFMMDDGDRTSDVIARLLAEGGTRPAVTLTENGQRASGVFVARRVGPAGTLLSVVETGNREHGLQVTINPIELGLAAERRFSAAGCFTDESHVLASDTGWSFKTTIPAGGVSCFLIADVASIDKILPRERLLSLPRDPAGVLLAKGPWDSARDAQRPYLVGDAMTEHLARLQKESMGDCPKLPDPVDFGKGYFGLDLQPVANEPLGKMIPDLDLSAISSAAGTNPEMPKFGAGPVHLGTVPALSGPKVLSVLRDVRGIPVGQRVESLHFFHGGRFSEHESLVGHYRVRYAGGAVEMIPIIVQTTIGDFRRPVFRTPRFEHVFEGKDAKGGVYRLMRYDWINPWPEKTVESIDIVNALATKERPLKVWAISTKRAN